MAAKKKATKKKAPAEAAPCSHEYGGWRSEKGWDGHPRVILRCSKCERDYFPHFGSGECPHPCFGERDEAHVAQCLACGTRKRFMPVPYVGGPCDGEVGWSLPSSIEDPWSWPMTFTSKGQEPDDKGSTTMFSYSLRFNEQGYPFWQAPDRSSSGE